MTTVTYGSTLPRRPSAPLAAGTPEDPAAGGLTAADLRRAIRTDSQPTTVRIEKRRRKPASGPLSALQPVSQWSPSGTPNRSGDSSLFVPPATFGERNSR